MECLIEVKKYQLNQKPIEHLLTETTNNKSQLQQEDKDLEDGSDQLDSSSKVSLMTVSGSLDLSVNSSFNWLEMGNQIISDDVISSSTSSKQSLPQQQNCKSINSTCGSLKAESNKKECKEQLVVKPLIYTDNPLIVDGITTLLNNDGELLKPTVSSHPIKSKNENNDDSNESDDEDENEASTSNEKKQLPSTSSSATQTTGSSSTTSTLTLRTSTKKQKNKEIFDLYSNVVNQKSSNANTLEHHNSDKNITSKNNKYYINIDLKELRFSQELNILDLDDLMRINNCQQPKLKQTVSEKSRVTIDNKNANDKKEIADFDERY
jgi:hypothetical protein